MNSRKVKEIVKFSIHKNLQSKWFIILNVLILISTIIMTNMKNIDTLLKNNNINLENNIINERAQKKFLETMLGKTINTAIDIGIRAIFPNFVEDQVINIKNNLRT